jgi:hypothetical protein
MLASAAVNIVSAQELTMPDRWKKSLLHVRSLYNHDTLTIKVLGDVMMHSAQINNAHRGGSEYDFSSYFSLIEDQIKEAVGGFGATLIKDGKIATTNNTGRASRTAIGITAEGKVVMMVLDGRQEPFSAGGSMVEIAQIMLEAGCVHAVNLDGGGSTTYLSKAEGSDDLKLINRPSDGYARSVATSLVAISFAKSSKEFDHANISSEYDYLTIGTSLTRNAFGVSNTGFSALIPEGTVWKVSDETIGSITADGVFTALDNGGFYGSTLNVGLTDLQFLTFANANNLIKGNNTVVFGVQLFDEKNVAFLHFVLLTAGFKNCVHYKAPHFLIENSLWQVGFPLKPDIRGLKDYNTRFFECQSLFFIICN